MTAPLPAARLVEADRNAAQARQRLSSTVAELQARLDPSRLADQALTEVKAAGSASIAVAEQNRGALIGTGAAIGLILARRPLLRLFRRKPEPPVPDPDPAAATDPDTPR